MMVNLNRLAILEGVSLNKVFSVLADRQYLLSEVEFDGFDFANPMIEERFVDEIIFVCETIPKEEKLKNKVIVDLFKEKVALLREKAKIEKEVYKAMAFVYKKFEAYCGIDRKEVIEICEELHEEQPEDLKVAIYRELAERSGAIEVNEYYQKLFFEKVEKEKIKAELMASLEAPKTTPETPEATMEIDGQLVDMETGEVIADAPEEEMIEYRVMEKRNYEVIEE